MSVFFTELERKRFGECPDPVLQNYRWALAMRCLRRAAQGGLLSREDSVPWWYAAYEVITDGAMHVSLSKPDEVAPWLRSVVMEVARKSEREWVGPSFRHHGGGEPSGNLETAHLAWAVALALDLAPSVFTEGEKEELRTVLRERAIPMCRRYLEGPGGRTVANWRCVLGSGLAVAAAVLGDESMLDEAERLFALNVLCFQEDGSYGESFQYAQYAMTALTLHHEALVRARPRLLESLSILPYARGVRWAAANLLYRAPAGGFGPSPRPWSVNFNDSGALVAPPPDVLLAISARCRDKEPEISGLARWIHDTFTPPVPDPGPHDRSSFGFLPRFGWLSLVHFPGAGPSVSPAQAKLPEGQVFDNGDAILRDAWGGSTVLAIRGGGRPLNGPGHLHADIGHFILAHGTERLLADPGHSCYRGLVRAGEVESQAHNTLTFLVPGEGGERHLQQPTTEAGWWKAARVPHRRLENGQPGPAVDRGALRILHGISGGLRVSGTSFGACYGDPIETCRRFWFLCGPHALFVVDHVVASLPVRTQWNWVLDNHDGALELKDPLPDRIIARRGAVGMKLFHVGPGSFGETLHGWMHLAYHPLPGRLGEGASGTAALVRFRESTPRTDRMAVHGIVMDGYGRVAGWHLKTASNQTVLEGPGAAESWALTVDEPGVSFNIKELVSGRAWSVKPQGDDTWNLIPEEKS